LWLVVRSPLLRGRVKQLVQELKDRITRTTPRKYFQVPDIFRGFMVLKDRTELIHRILTAVRL
jgi:hypothetical protein